MKMPLRAGWSLAIAGAFPPACSSGFQFRRTAGSPCDGMACMHGMASFSATRLGRVVTASSARGVAVLPASFFGIAFLRRSKLTGRSRPLSSACSSELPFR